MRPDTQHRAPTRTSARALRVDHRRCAKLHQRLSYPPPDGDGCPSLPRPAGPRQRLTGDLAVIEHRHSGITWGHQGKLHALYTWTAARPVAVLDDEHGGTDPYDAQRRTAEGLPTLLVPVNGHTGLRRTDIDQVHTWLDTLHDAR
jgi:hypothetical protein